ncbi:MAG: hypothetical protein M3N93_00610 [Acidobacteriota bacterium]|nr:hypothetical protein [Acidobacteriota bacterium]
MKAKIRVLRAVLWVLYVAAAAILMAWIFLGPFHLILPVSNPLNAEAIAALAFLLLTLLRTRMPEAPSPGKGASFAVIAPVIAITGLAFLPAVNNPLLHDAYSHVWNAATGTWSGLYSILAPPPGSAFFRPLGDLSYRLDYNWAGTNATAWNLWNLGLHLINTCLVWVLARQLSRGLTCATVAALIFGLHGTRPEVVAWVGARFDLLASFFAIAALLALLRYIDTGAARWYAAIAFCSFCAFLSKEAAYCLPLLALLLMPFRERPTRRRILRAVALIVAVCAVVFIYRTWVLGDIGGYRTAGGAPSILQFSAIRTVKALLYREWAVLLFPVNWSSANLILKWAMVLMTGIAAAFPFYSKASRTRLATSLLWVIAAALPAQHLLLIAPDLNGARVLYLPVLGLALFWGFLAEGCDYGIARILLPAGLLLFQLVALEHNLKIWRGVALLGQRTCKAMGAELSRDPRSIVVGGLPATWQGIYFLKNGFPQCVAINTRQSINRISVQEDNPAAVGPNARLFIWNNGTGRLEEHTGP